jgi:hypothetical protein
MAEEEITKLDQFPAPYNRQVEIFEVKYETGIALLRIRIREGKRFTIMDVDHETAARWAALMGDWAGAQLKRLGDG